MKSSQASDSAPVAVTISDIIPVKQLTNILLTADQQLTGALTSSLARSA